MLKHKVESAKDRTLEVHVTHSDKTEEQLAKDIISKNSMVGPFLKLIHSIDQYLNVS